MDPSLPPPTGFSSHVQEQLRLAAETVTYPEQNRGQGRRGRGRGRGRSRNVYRALNYGHHDIPPSGFQQQPQQQSQQQFMEKQILTNPGDVSSFPPLGTNYPLAQSTEPSLQQQQILNQQQQSFQRPQYRSQYRPANLDIGVNDSFPPSRRGHFQRSHGGQYRGDWQRLGTDPYRQTPMNGHHLVQNPDDFARPASAQRSLYAPNPQQQFVSLDSQRTYRQRIIDQSDYLNHLVASVLKTKLLSFDEQKEKEKFRKMLETIAQEVTARLGGETSSIDPEQVKLKMYGSLGNGFGVSGCDMDLLLAFPTGEGSIGDIEIDSRRELEKALLDAGIGARLLTNTRVPILRVCQKPGPELLKNLRENRLKWEHSLDTSKTTVVDEGYGALPLLSDEQMAQADRALAELDIQTAVGVTLPASPPPEHAKLEYIGDCGIQCDINFSNYVALDNTHLLRNYGQCDVRVRQLGVFVKAWAKARDINTPYRGTLSSYGYILMVLHYLMNVASPPIIPNLQDWAKQDRSRLDTKDPELVEGFDVRFIRDMNEVQAIMSTMPRNHESVGSLLRGFFHYYANPKGFHWNQDIISIRTRGGRLAKRWKGWTEAKWAAEKSTVRLRYLLAIEDPFEIEHNVARTVGHNGIVAIRDEFRRAWTAIENIQQEEESKIWYWLSPDGEKVDGDEMMTEIENRGDLLRKDQDHHRQRMRNMKQELEAKEKALKDAAAQEVLDEIESVDSNSHAEPPAKATDKSLVLPA